MFSNSSELLIVDGNLSGIYLTCQDKNRKRGTTFQAAETAFAGSPTTFTNVTAGATLSRGAQLFGESFVFSVLSMFGFQFAVKADRNWMELMWPWIFFRANWYPFEIISSGVRFKSTDHLYIGSSRGQDSYENGWNLRSQQRLQPDLRSDFLGLWAEGQNVCGGCCFNETLDIIWICVFTLLEEHWIKSRSKIHKAGLVVKKKLKRRTRSTTSVLRPLYIVDPCGVDSPWIVAHFGGNPWVF